MHQNIQKPQQSPNLHAQELTLVTSNPKKAEEVQRHLDTSNVTALVRHVSPQSLFSVENPMREYMPTERMNSLRFQGPAYYADVARESALDKINYLIKNGDPDKVRAGLVIEDSSFFSYAWDGYPGILAADLFNGAVGSDGTRSRNQNGPLAVSLMAMANKDFRAAFICTFARLVKDDDGKLDIRVHQGIAQGYVVPHPRGDGWSFDSVFCPDPILLAKHLGQESDLRELKRVRDELVDLPLKADCRGLLKTFAEIPEHKHIFSPRIIALNDMAKSLAE